MSGIPENRNDVETLVNKGEKDRLVDSEYDHRKRETGDRVKRRREELGYSRADLSKRIGIAESTISFIEQGRSAPNPETHIILCQGLQQTADYIIGLRTRNYRDVMRDSKTAHLVPIFFLKKLAITTNLVVSLTEIK